VARQKRRKVVESLRDKKKEGSVTTAGVKRTESRIGEKKGESISSMKKNSRLGKGGPNLGEKKKHK